MRKIVFVTGPVRSGKSSFAVELAKKTKQKVVFIATCRPLDEEMKARVSKHRETRPKEWETREEELNIASVLKSAGPSKTVIIDCITLWVSNLLMRGFEENKLKEEIIALVSTLRKIKSSVIIVSNEVGWGIVPDNGISRAFRDIIGLAHQEICAASDEAYLMVCGIPVKLK
jgi:adenosylcobinamide kinase / adenosylcobinamide-phosphate guanylyltransferase